MQCSRHFMTGKTSERRAGGGGAASVQGPEDLSFEVTASLDKKISHDVQLCRGPRLQPIFPTGVLHLRYQRLVTLQGVDHVTQVSIRLWQGGRFVLKRSLTDRNVPCAFRRKSQLRTQAEHDHMLALLEG